MPASSLPSPMVPMRLHASVVVQPHHPEHDRAAGVERRERRARAPGAAGSGGVPQLAVRDGLDVEDQVGRVARTCAGILARDVGAMRPCTCGGRLRATRPDAWSMTRARAAAVAVALALVALGGRGVAGCAHPPPPPVQPWQREYLAKRALRFDADRSRIASGSTGSARAKAPTSATVSPAAAAAAIEARRALAARRLVAASAALAARRARADDRVTIRGAYYREPSTRVIQPVVEIDQGSAARLRRQRALPGRRHHLRLGRRRHRRSTPSSPRSATRSGSASARPGTAPASTLATSTAPSPTTGRTPSGPR